MPPSPFHITCQDVVELVTEYLEHALEAQDASLFEQHLNFCDGCVSYVDQVRLTIDRVAHLGAEDVPDETRARLLAAFREWSGA